MRIEKAFINEANRICEERGWHWTEIPVFVRWCDLHHRYEWYDPFDKASGSAKNKQTLRTSLIRRYQCPNCGYFHIYEMCIMPSMKIVDFLDFDELP
jgi:hypothetical protein